MRLAIGLIVYMAVMGILATLVPQGREPEFYASRYPRLIADLVVSSGFTSFFRSWLFILPAFLFFANLSACTMTRLLNELKKKERRRHGPDILHLGLMILVVGAIMTFSGRQEGAVRLAEGDAVELPDGRLLRLERFEYLAYADGRPREWTSEVALLNKEGKPDRANFPIRVNAPLKVGAISIYQVSHEVERLLVLRMPGAEGPEVQRSLAQGEEFEAGGTSVFFMAPDDGSGKAVVRIKTRDAEPSVRKVLAGDTLGPFVVAAIENRDISGLEAVVDPGYPIVLAGLLLSALGIFATFIRKLKDVTP